jgi:hypothetical protein
LFELCIAWRRYDNQQQVQAPVERINLKDFGFVKTDRLKKNENRGDQRGDVKDTKDIPIAVPSNPSSSSVSDCSQCVDSRFLQHYEAKNCEPTMRPGCNCPMKYDCPTLASKNSSGNQF